MLAAPTGGSTPAVRRTAAEEKKGPDLIQRYKLDSKAETLQAEETSTEPTKIAWTSNKTDRQTLLQKRREEMILAARRKMLESSKDK
jgi:coupling of ubiquitin conjugation to ER degradation protein 1